MGLINGTVVLENNYELWASMYESEKNNLVHVFMEENFVYEHVGSTAVKNLLAKPIVDIAVGVKDIRKIDKYIDELKTIYTVKNNTNLNEILLIKESKLETFFLIHILPIESERYKNLIRFRNILNDNHELLKKYENLKIELAKKYSNDRKKYTEMKNELIRSILDSNKTPI